MKKFNLLFKGLASSLIFSAILFICAGRLNYFQGWIYLSTNFITALMSFIAIGNNTALLEERSRAGQGVKSWDKLLLGLSAIVFIITLILAGLDTGRYDWSSHWPWWFYVSGIVLTLTGHSIFLTAQRQNRFFSTVVRIQTERGHTVCDSGIYRVIRHPGYFGMMLSLTGLPFLTGSLWSVIPTLAAIILLLIRTQLEDKTLRNELTGYLEYTNKTRYKLIPRVW